jgi:hypothetical protein
MHQFPLYAQLLTYRYGAANDVQGQTRTWLFKNHHAVAAHGDRLLVCLLASRFLLASIFESLRNLPADGFGRFNSAVRFAMWSARPAFISNTFLDIKAERG